jgi:asparagine synthase (glutamine-hydrolysing)
MCGIVGAIGKPFDIDEPSKAISHRGPDSSGSFSDDFVSLGFNRLRIIDLSPQGDQPMKNEDGNVWLVFNGEIYNYQDLRSQLIKKHKFVSTSDTEVLIHGYEEWGIDRLLKKLNGMFAFCLYDVKKRRAYLVRDRIGKKPLYYTFNDGVLRFASETKAFFKYKDFKFNIDPESFELFMGFSYIPDNQRTIISGVKKVSPGSYLLMTDSKSPVVKTYWSLENLEINNPPSDSTDSMEDLLMDSVKKRLIADVPVGILLSGGLDSSLITALATKNSKETIRTVNISFKNSSIDEREYARIVADHCSTDHTELNVDVEDTYKEMRSYIGIFDDLSTVDGGLLSTYLMSRLLRDTDIRVMLVGEGADEVFGGYTWFQFSQFPFSLLPRRLVASGYYYAIMRITSNPRFLRYPKELYQRMEESRGDIFKKIQYHEIKYSLPNHYCMKVDKGTSAASMEARAPYLDYRIIELARRLPKGDFLQGSTVKMRGAPEKYILRKIAKKYLPKSIYTRRKRGGMLPADQILSQGIKNDRDLILSNKHLQEFFGEGYLRGLIDSQPSLRPLKWQREWILWKSLIFSLWYEFYERY